MRSKVTVVGAGNVGATAAQRIYDKGYADVVLVDIVEGLPQGKALDMLEAGPILGSDASIIGTNDYADTAGSDIVVITSGVARRPGMSRDDLLLTNMNISHQRREAGGGALSQRHATSGDQSSGRYGAAGLPGQWPAQGAGVRHGRHPRHRALPHVHSPGPGRLGRGGGSTFVLGGHGDTMVPIAASTTVGGTPLSELLPPERVDALVKRTQDGGAEIVNLLKSGSAYYAPSAAIVQMVESILLDKKQILPCTAYLEGEYGIDGIYVGVPVKLGAGGVEEIIEFQLTAGRGLRAPALRRRRARTHRGDGHRGVGGYRAKQHRIAPRGERVSGEKSGPKAVADSVPGRPTSGRHLGLARVY